MSTVTREQILLESCTTTDVSMPVSRMPLGTLAVSGDNVLMLVGFDGNWVALLDGFRSELQLTKSFPSVQGAPLLIDIPADVWPSICDERSHIKRIRIARAAVGLAPSENELVEAAGLAQRPALTEIGKAAAGTLLVRLGQLALVKNQNCWSWLEHNARTPESFFNPAARHLTAAVLVTGIPNIAWPELCDARSNLERVRIAVTSAAAAATAAAATTDDQLRRDLAEQLDINQSLIHLHHDGVELFVEITTNLGSKQRQESLTAWLLRKTRVDLIHLAGRPGWTSLSMPKPQAIRKTT
jgi:hypothetical protein